jgi:hypothetical protein
MTTLHHKHSTVETDSITIDPCSAFGTSSGIWRLFRVWLRLVRVSAGHAAISAVSSPSMKAR